jgi:hypothetical protein
MSVGALTAVRRTRPGRRAERRRAAAELSARFRTDAVHTAEREVGGVGWELRLAVVSVDDRERMLWPRLLPTQTTEPPV